MHDQRRAAPPALSGAAIFWATLIAALWGGTSVAIRFSVDQLPPVYVAGWRFLLGTLFLAGWCLWERSSLRLISGQWKPCAIAGLLLFVQISLFNVGVAESNSSHGSLFINTFVFWVIGIEHFVTRADRLTRSKLFGTVLAALSVLLLLLTVDAVVSGEPEAPTLKGDLILCLSAALLGVKVIWMKVSLRTVEPTKLVFWHNIIGVVCFFAWSAAFETVNATAL